MSKGVVRKESFSVILSNNYNTTRSDDDEEIAAYHLPHLHDVVFRNAAQDPRIVRVPSEVRYLGSVTTMYELKM